jgi:hypothetical protein
MPTYEEERNRGSEETGEREGDFAGEPKEGRLVVQGWLIVCSIVLVFMVYGIFAFFVIGDKGPSDWDFGGVQDIPGGSEYATYPYRIADSESNPQHVDGRPPDAKIDISGPPPTPGKLLEGPGYEGKGKGKE